MKRSGLEPRASPSLHALRMGERLERTHGAGRAEATARKRLARAPAVGCTCAIIGHVAHGHEGAVLRCREELLLAQATFADLVFKLMLHHSLRNEKGPTPER